MKTRLSPPLPAGAGAEVYEACLRDVVAGASAEAKAVEICFHDTAGAQEWFAAQFPNVRATAQASGDMGAKLTQALDRFFGEGVERVVVLGSDAPGLPRGRVRQAFGALQSADVVLGPTDDGGQYLVGLRSSAWPAASALFEGLPWSSARLFTQMRERARTSGLRLTTLPLWYDVDQVADLARVAPHLRAGTHLARWLAGPTGQRYIGDR